MGSEMRHNIKRSKRHERFYIVSHELIDCELSAEALGVAVYVLSRPDDWVIRPSQLSNKFGCGKNRMTRILKEIVEARFATKEHVRGEDGLFGGVLWTFSEAPYPQNPSTVNRVPDNPPLLNKDNKHNKEYNYIEFAKCISLASGFDVFWGAYPRKDVKKKTMELWCKLNPDLDLINKITNNIWDRLHSGAWSLSEKNFIPQPTTYLNQERWNDEVIPRAKQLRANKYPEGSIRGRGIVDNLTDTSWFDGEIESDETAFDDSVIEGEFINEGE